MVVPTKKHLIIAPYGLVTFPHSVYHKSIPNSPESLWNYSKHFVLSFFCLNGFIIFFKVSSNNTLNCLLGFSCLVEFPYKHTG